jgi:3',5'-nucleoside bisphosphate phosphatase
VSIDLHTHSRASDGTDTPAELVERAAALGLHAVALTDHDTLSGLEEAAQAAQRAGIRLVQGTELSVEHDRLKIHMLVHFLEPTNGPLQDRLAELRDGRTTRNTRIVARLNDLGYEISEADVASQAGGEAVGRPHIADAMIAKGYFDSRAEVFDAVLADGGAAYVQRLRLTAVDAIALATASGAVTTVAHPYTIDRTAPTYAPLFAELRDLGLSGLEAHYPEHAPQLRAHLAELAGDLGLVATGGSDYHGTGKPGIELGSGYGDLVVPDGVLDELEDRRP